MLNKDQIREQLRQLLAYRDVASKRWYLEQIEGLLSSIDSPEKFVEAKK